MANVVLVRLFNPLQPQTSVPIGIGYLLKALEQVKGVESAFIDCQLENIDEDRLLDNLKQTRPRIVGFQVYSIDYHRFTSVLPRLRTLLPEAVIIAGGPHISGLPEHSLICNPALDLAVKGEGEEAVAMIARYVLEGTFSEHMSSIPNIVYRNGANCVHNPTQWIDVKAWGAPAWHLLRPDTYPAFQHGGSHKGGEVAPILTSRGCPYPCTYCAGHLVTGKTIRLRDVVDIVDEMEMLNTTYGIDEFLIEDENFSFYKEQVFAFIKEIKRRNAKYFFSFPNGLRMDKLDDQLIESLREMGTYRVSVGIESGSQKTLQSVKKKWDFDTCIQVIKRLKHHGIEVRGFFILGFPDETLEDMYATINFALRCGVDSAYFQNFLPLPGTEAFTLLLERKEISLETINWEIFSGNVGQYPYAPRGIPVATLRKVIRSAYLKFYLRPRQIFLVLSFMTSVTFIKGFLFACMAILKPSKDAGA